MSNSTTTTEHKIGKITYLVSASPSDGATDTIEKKLEKLIMKDMRRNTANTGKNPKN